MLTMGGTIAPYSDRGGPTCPVSRVGLAIYGGTRSRLGNSFRTNSFSKRLRIWTPHEGVCSGTTRSAVVNTIAIAIVAILASYNSHIWRQAKGKCEVHSQQIEYISLCIILSAYL